MLPSRSTQPSSLTNSPLPSAPQPPTATPRDTRAMSSTSASMSLVPSLTSSRRGQRNTPKVSLTSRIKSSNPSNRAQRLSQHLSYWTFSSNRKLTSSNCHPRFARPSVLSSVSTYSFANCSILLSLETTLKPKNRLSISLTFWWMSQSSN